MKPVITHVGVRVVGNTAINGSEHVNLNGVVDVIKSINNRDDVAYVDFETDWDDNGDAYIVWEIIFETSMDYTILLNIIRDEFGKL